MVALPATVELLAAGAVLVVSLGLGTVAHELAHAAVLRASSIPFRIDWLPNRQDVGPVRATVWGTWAAVTPLEVPDGDDLGLRLAGVAPFALAAPGVLVVAGVVTDPFAAGNLLPSVAAIGWFACAIPSPRDFSLFLHGADPDDLA